VTPPDSLRELIAATSHTVELRLDEASTVQAVSAHVRRALQRGVDVPAEYTNPLADRYAMYPLHVAPDGSFSVAVAVWGVGQVTPIHDHGCWGVVGVISGIEHEQRYALIDGAAPRMIDERDLQPGSVLACCTAEQDVHVVSCKGDEKVVALHLYGADIGRKVRHVFDPTTGTSRDFVSSWCDAPDDADR
jgi:predicted metal-dependent enzyme (double-stranded beta helix superfamily)